MEASARTGGGAAVARLTFPHFHRLTAGLSGAVRLERFEALSPGAQDACWRDLARELEETRP